MFKGFIRDNCEFGVERLGNLLFDLLMYFFRQMFDRNVDLREYLTEEAQATEKNTTYDLVANVVHDGKPTEGSYRIHVMHHVSAVKPFDQVWLLLLFTYFK